MSVMMPEFKVRRRDKRIWFVGLAIFAGVFLFTFLAGRFRAVDSDAGAASLAEFDPGYIISDWQMGNYASMTEAEIQAFLTAKNSCWQTSYEYYLELTAASLGVKWHFENGHFVCLSEELFGDGEVIGKGETAAHVIWQAAQDYRINPQVLLVLLQKETGLITDPIPNNYDYRKATGYGCPDTAPCSAEYYGLKNQIRHAAALFRTVLDGGWTNYPLGVNYVQYNPSWECGGSEVNIRSLATSALYRYTPYQPNAGALAAGYGTAYCGAYGNRNFYLYFEDWFGGIRETKSKEDLENERIRATFSNNIDYSGNYKMLYAGEINKGLTINVNNVEATQYNDKKEYQWQITKENDYYIITNKATGKALDLSGGVFSNKANIWQYNVNKTCAQRWNFVKNNDGTVTIHSSCYPQYVLDLADGASNVQVYTKTSYENEHQKWVLEPVDAIDIENGEYRIYDVDKIKVVGIDNKSNVEAGGFLSSASHVWVIERVQNRGYYTITNKDTGRVLGVTGKTIENKTNIAECKKGECAYFWYFERNGDFMYIINAEYLQFAIDLADGQANLQVYKKIQNNSHQKWLLWRLNDGDLSGERLIKYFGNKSKTLSVENGITEAGSNIVAEWNMGRDSQVWNIQKENDYYIITNKATGKALDLSGGVFSNKANIWQYNVNKTCAQRWNFVKNNDGTVTIHSSCYPQYVLDLADGASNVQVYTKTSYENEHQKWVLDDEIDADEYDGVYSIVYGGDSSRAIGLENGSSEAMVNVVVGKKDIVTAGKWQITKENDYYIITNKATGKALDLSGGVFSNKANIWQYNVNKTCAQRWNFVKNNDGTVTIHSSCYPQYVLDLADGASNVQVYTKTSYENEHQKWVLKRS